jgi:hypothetical protein
MDQVAEEWCKLVQPDLLRRHHWASTLPTATDTGTAGSDSKTPAVSDSTPAVSDSKTPAAPDPKTTALSVSQAPLTTVTVSVCPHGHTIPGAGGAGSVSQPVLVSTSQATMI